MVVSTKPLLWAYVKKGTKKPSKLTFFLPGQWSTFFHGDVWGGETLTVLVSVTLPGRWSLMDEQWTPEGPLINEPPYRWQQDTCLPSKRWGPGSSGVDIQLSALINLVLQWSLIFYLHTGFHVSQKEREVIVDNLYSLIIKHLVFVLIVIAHKSPCQKMTMMAMFWL